MLKPEQHGPLESAVVGRSFPFCNLVIVKPELRGARCIVMTEAALKTAQAADATEGVQAYTMCWQCCERAGATEEHRLSR